MSSIRIAVIGLGYVGLPLARLFATKYPVVGFDVNQQRVNEINQGIDRTLEVEEQILKAALVSESPVAAGKNGLFCSFNPGDIKACNFYVTPTGMCFNYSF